MTTALLAAELVRVNDVAQDLVRRLHSVSNRIDYIDDAFPATSRALAHARDCAIEVAGLLQIATQGKGTP